ncbi:alpha/beta fold hydrolase [Agrobacterium fabrum]|uniref:alpha/beta fold hydrolase n=1 Tax=Agrobacterium fabrum TaxID=1176649 RepID=UPI002158075F|nr:alpha/beta hydrolase [Agrobacterium fabrum]MCR6727640.1 alpha/beta hydrolase [Agrobacterium fabrum]
MTNNALPIATTSVVLVHGATMDGSSWRPVHDILKAAGLEVAVVQLPLTSLQADIDATLLCISRQVGSVVLVGHSYGGVVASVAGTHPKVRALVYVAALQPDKGESLATLAARFPFENHMLDLGDGIVILDPVHYAHDMADDISHGDAAFLAASQRPTAMAIFGTAVTEPAWRDKPSFAIVATNDRILHPELARYMYARSNSEVMEIEASHVPHLSHPKAVAEFILGATNS